MFYRRTLAFTAALFLAMGGLAACAESPAEDSEVPAGDASAVEATAVSAEMPTAETVEVATEATEMDRVADANGCRPSSQEVLDTLTSETEAAGATIGNSASSLLEVDEMIYGTWEVNAVAVTTKDGTEETALWVTKVLPPGQWSSSASKESLGYSLNEVAAEVSSFAMATEQEFGREISASDDAALAAMACLP